MGRAVVVGMAPQPQARGVRTGMDRDRLSAGREPRLPHRHPTRRADPLPAVGGPGAGDRGWSERPSRRFVDLFYRDDRFVVVPVKWLAVAAILVAGGIRTALRVPVWRDDKSVTLSIFDDSPASYRGPARTAGLFQSAGQAAKALAAYQAAARIYDRDPTVFVGAADAAFSLGRPTLADALLIRVDQLCFRCTGYLYVQAVAARSRGDSATAGWLEGRARDWERQ